MNPGAGRVVGPAAGTGAPYRPFIRSLATLEAATGDRPVALACPPVTPGDAQARPGQARDEQRRWTVGVFDRFEKGIERAVNGAFAKAFRSEVQPVEVASALRRECDDRATVVGRDRYIAPNTYVVELGSADYERIGEWEDALANELGAVVTEHAGHQRYGFVGPVTVAFEEAGDLDTGVFRIRSSTTQGAAAPQPYPPPQPGPGYPPPEYQAPPGPPAGYPPQYPAQYAPQQPPAPPAGPPQPAGLELNGQLYPLTAEVTVLGRSSETDIPLDDTGVSRRHAEIRRTPQGFELVDLGSTNGSFVNGERVSVVPLADGSLITLGRTRIVFHAGRR